MTSILTQKTLPVNSSPFSPSTCQSGIVATGSAVVTTEQPADSVVYRLKKFPRSPSAKNPLAICHTEECNKYNGLGRELRVYNHLLEVPESEELTKAKRFSNGDKPKAKRGKITQRSKKSRLNQEKYIYKLPFMPEQFTLITWADDVSGYLSQREKKELFNFHMKQLHDWLAYVLRKQEWFVVWSREWKIRKSGEETKGQLVPHVHLLWRVNGMSEADYMRFNMRLNLKWIQITGTKDVGNALMVSSDPKNNQYLGNSPKKAISYCVKYCKDQYSDMGEPDESIGRCWGAWGTIKTAMPEKINLDEYDIIKLKRLLRKKAKKAKGWYLSSLKIMPMGTMAFVWGSELIRYIEWLSLSHHAPGVPF